MEKKNGLPEKLIKEASLEALILGKPKGIWNVYSFSNTNTTILSEPALMLKGTDISLHLSHCQQIAIMAITVGEQLEEKISLHFNQGNYSLGLLLDAAATTLVESAADQMTELIRQFAAKQGFHITSRYSPGYGDWDVTTQPDILRLANAEQIGLSATETCMLIPRKSVTAVIGFALSEEINRQKCQYPSCTTCALTNCPIRKETQI